MKIMVVGGGGREHAIIKKIKENKNVSEIYALPGNGGMAKDAVCVDIGAKDIDAITKFAVDNQIDFAIVDSPLLLSNVYGKINNSVPNSFYNLTLDYFKSYNNINFFVQRKHNF
jgi:phosphoribosylamine--glycine ligase